eukprot:CAMPEP_0181317350 /NCGR_PEP_ID=MMETSP1101-20121128/16421_1 /TAXON_ID=46948 /ORGANISM="Rhodomonas abbreviata, Strain Caron Lab Isolate" /LENGTH=37 /DNA_ID= /DNA_START= /DNA_END= /DNA_ORIENTATION=
MAQVQARGLNDDDANVETRLPLPNTMEVHMEVLPRIA